MLGMVMVKGLKQSSSVVSIGFNATETAANTFTQSSVDLNLSPLDREVFVVLAINLDPFTPDVIAGTSSLVRTSLTTTSQTAVQEISSANCLANSNNTIRMGAGSVEGVPFQTLGLETPPATLEFIGIIATNDFFVQIAGTANTLAKQVNGKLYGYRAVADASIFAALVQSEVLSA
jgi:hypothetical protein|tara:strand:- start:141 stop:668 length:528 start_codon:yes stop_codon:yes gene_type:complete